MNLEERTLGRGKGTCKGLKVEESSGMWANEGSACGISNPGKGGTLMGGLRQPLPHAKPLGLIRHILFWLQYSENLRLCKKCDFLAPTTHT